MTVAPLLFDTVVVGSPNPTPVDYVPENPCDYVWEERVNGIAVFFSCTRDYHTSGQHVAEGDEVTGVIAVAPWQN